MGYQTEIVSPGTDLFIYPFVAMFAWNFLIGAWCQIWGKRDNSWVDVSYGICFIIPNVYIFFARWLLEGDVTPRMILVTSMVCFWGFRLAYHIWARHTREDYRYKELREGWERNGSCGYYVRAFAYVWFMQGVFASIVNCSALYINLFSVKDPLDDSFLGLWYTDYVGVAVWIIGYLIETISDA